MNTNVLVYRWIFPQLKYSYPDAVSSVVNNALFAGGRIKCFLMCVPTQCRALPIRGQVSHLGARHRHSGGNFHAPLGKHFPGHIFQLQWEAGPTGNQTPILQQTTHKQTNLFTLPLFAIPWSTPCLATQHVHGEFSKPHTQSSDCDKGYINKTNN